MRVQYVYTVILALIGCLLPLISYATSPVWKVTQGQNSVYLAGTIHVLSPSDYPLPKAFQVAYQASSELIFETDLEKIRSPENQQYFLSKMRYQNGQRLDQYISAETYRELRRKLTSYPIDISTLLNFKPGFVGTTLTVLELKRLGMTDEGVDGFYFQKAKQDGKTTGQLESVKSQIDFLASLGEGNEEALIRHMLDELNQIPELMSKTKNAWRKGNVKALEDTLLIALVRDYPEVYQSLLVDRNFLWLPQIEQMLRSSKTEFVLVGALHLVGRHGLLFQLEKAGYVIEQLP